MNGNNNAAYKSRVKALLANMQNTLDPVTTAQEAIDLFLEICASYESNVYNDFNNNKPYNDLDWFCLYDGYRLEISIDDCEIVSHIVNSNFESAYIYLTNDLIWNIGRNDKGISISVVKNGKVIYDITRKLNGTTEDEKDLRKKITAYLDSMHDISSKEVDYKDINLFSNIGKEVELVKKVAEVAVSVGAVLSSVFEKEEHSNQQGNKEYNNVEKVEKKVLNEDSLSSMNKEITLIDKSGKKLTFNSFPVIIGRLENCNIFINDKRVSRNHAQIIEKDGNFYLQDMGSANGTFYKGQRINKMIELLHGDSFLIVDYEYRVEIPNKQPEKTIVISNIPSSIQSSFVTQSSMPPSSLSSPLVSPSQSYSAPTPSSPHQAIHQLPPNVPPPKPNLSQSPTPPPPFVQPSVAPSILGSQHSHGVTNWQNKSSISQNQHQLNIGQTHQSPNLYQSPLPFQQSQQLQQQQFKFHQNQILPNSYQSQPQSQQNLTPNISSNASLSNQQSNKIYSFSADQFRQHSIQPSIFSSSEQQVFDSNKLQSSSHVSSERKNVFVFDPSQVQVMSSQQQSYQMRPNANLRFLGFLLFLLVAGEIAFSWYATKSIDGILKNHLEYASLLTIVILSIQSNLIHDIRKKYLFLGLCGYILYSNVNFLKHLPAMINSLGKLNLLAISQSSIYYSNMYFLLGGMILRLVTLILVGYLGFKVISSK